MKLLLDTHAFIWWINSSNRLSETVLTLLKSRQHQIILSVASTWEMQIKLLSGKLTLVRPLRDVIETQQQVNALQLLSIELKHVLALDTLPMHHRDPFDRLLIAQAKVEDAVLVSTDPVFQQYQVNLLW